MKRVGWIACAALAAGCAGGGEGNADASADADAQTSEDGAPAIDASAKSGFVPPETVTTAYALEDGDGDPSFVEIGPANWDCLGEPDEVAPIQDEVRLSGIVSDFQTGRPVAGIEIVAFDSNDFFADPIAGPVTSSEEQGAEGSYDGLAIAAGVRRVAIRTAGEGFLDTYSLGLVLEPGADEAAEALSIVSESTADTLAALVLQRPRTDGRGIVAGEIVDCDGHTVRHAIATVSATAGELDHLPGARTYYLNGSATDPIPRRDRTESHRDGLFLIPELEPSERHLYVQIWGFPDQDALDAQRLSLLSELETTIKSDGVISAELAPLRSAP